MRLIDADALMEWAVNIGCDGRWGISLDDLTDAIEDAPTIEPSEMQWIYVDDEYPDGNLPKIGEPVLLCCEIYLKNPKVSVCHYMEIGTYEWDGEQNTGMWFVGDKQVYVSHWMPLPKFPEGYGR